MLLLYPGIKTHSQEKVYVPLFSCISCEKSGGYTAALIFSEAVNRKGNFQAVLADLRDTLYQPEDLSTTRESAELISTNYYVTGEISRLEGAYFIRVRMYATSSGLLFWSASKITHTPADLPVILSGFAADMANDKKRSGDGDLFLGNRSESKRVLRAKSNKSIGVMTGAMLPLSEYEIDHVNPGLGGLLSFDARNFIFEGSAEFYLASDSVLDAGYYSTVKNEYYNLNINVIYPITSGNNAPFACAGTGFSYRKSMLTYQNLWPSSSGSEMVYESGIAFSGGGGYILKRNSDSPLFLYARFYTIYNNRELPVYGVMFTCALKLEWR